MTPWPDWAGRPVAIVASGPSAKKNDFSLLRGRFAVAAVKKSWELVPWADVVYGCDAWWWKSVNFLPSFCGLKLAHDGTVAGQGGIRRVLIPDIHGDDLLFGETGTVGAGGNSGFQLLNLVVQWGATRVLLVGVDAAGKAGGEHWYGRNEGFKAGNPTQSNYERWARAFDRSAPVLRDRGVEVLNASFDSAVRAFPKRKFEEVVGEWTA